MDPGLLNWLKDVGIASATLLVLGRIMFLLLQVTSEFYRGVREDNRARNRQIEELLATNKAIAGQMVLTRHAILRSTRASEQQDSAIRANAEEVAALRTDLAAARQEILSSLDEFRAAHRSPVDSQRQSGV